MHKLRTSATHAETRFETYCKAADETENSACRLHKDESTVGTVPLVAPDLQYREEKGSVQGRHVGL